MKTKVINTHAFYYLFASLVFVCLPHLNHLPLWSLAFIGTTIVIKLRAIYIEKLTIPKWIVVLMTIGAVSGILLEYSQLFGRNAGITLLVVMLFLKLLETQTYRDGMLLACMMCFLVITNFLFEQRILMAAYLFIGVIAITHSFIKLNELPNTNTKKLEWPVYATKITLFALPVMVIFFIVFPRIPGPLWKLPIDHKAARSGLSETMRFGSIGYLALSNEPAFRVEFKGERPKQNELYWRGIIMEEFDGDIWSENKANVPAPNYITSGPSYEYTITLEPHNKKWLFALDLPTNTSTLAGSQFNHRYQLTNTEDIEKLKRYSLTSQTNYIIDRELSDVSRIRNTRIPINSNPRAVAFAKELRSTSKNDLEIIQKVLTHFRQEEFYYSLRPPQLVGDKIDEFLFSSRKGFCEHYAGSFVFLMRAAGIPARVVAGYQGGEQNALSDYMIVKQADAHAWAEVWLPSVGWRRVDPTAIISPSRIEGNVDEALDNSENPRFTLAYNNPALKSMRLLIDSMNHNWNQWVISYDRKKQDQLFKKIGLKYNASNAVTALTIFISLLFLIFYYFTVNKKDKKNISEKHQKLYEKFTLLFANQAIVKVEHENAIQFSARASEKFPYLKNQIATITEQYNMLEYANKDQHKLLDKLKNNIDKLETVLEKK